VLSFKNTEKKTSNQRVASAILSKLNEKQRFLLEHNNNMYWQHVGRFAGLESTRSLNGSCCKV
jgi:hypothetical protein